MTILTTPKKQNDGLYIVTMTMTVGTAELQYSTADFGDTLITDTAKTESATFELSLPRCTLTAVVTGDAVVSVIPLNRD
jgi:hypothetical protein